MKPGPSEITPATPSASGTPAVAVPPEPIAIEEANAPSFMSEIEKLPPETLQHLMTFTLNKRGLAPYVRGVSRTFKQNHDALTQPPGDLVDKQKREIQFILSNKAIILEKTASKGSNNQGVLQYLGKIEQLTINKKINNPSLEYHPLEETLDGLNRAIILARIKLSPSAELHCDACGLTRFPASLLEEKKPYWTSLLVLRLNNNQLASLPESFGCLTALLSLTLSNNHLTSLPESFGRLTVLQALALSYNQLASLPQGFGHLPALGELHLNNNQLASLPPEIPDSILRSPVGSSTTKADVLASQRPQPSAAPVEEERKTKTPHLR